MRTDKEIKAQEKKRERKNKLIAFLVMFFSLALLLGILWYVKIYSTEKEDEGIEVTFGDGDTGLGSSMAPQVSQTPPPSPSAAPKREEMLTQEDPSIDLNRQAQRAREEQLRKQREQELLEAQQREQQRREQERLQAERLAKEQDAIAKANAMGAIFDNTSDEGSGDSGGAGQQGSPLGHGSIGGNNWSLNGRDIQRLPPPSNNFNQEGRIVVNIQVDADGNVVNATIAGGTNISDFRTRNIAIDAAKKAKFSKSNTKLQVGTITYKFNYK